MFILSLKSCIPALAVILLAGCKPPQESLQQAIIGAVLIDGTGGPPVSDSVVIVAGSRIRAIGNRANTPIPAGVQKIDGRGKFLVPGLIDLHVHLGTRAGAKYDTADYTRERIERNLNAYLYFGVTSVRSMGIDRQAGFEVRKAEREGKLQTARLFTAGRGFTAPGGHPSQEVGDVVVQTNSPEEARKQVDTLAAQQVDAIKIWVDDLGHKAPKVKPAVMDAILDQARKYNIPVTAHIYSLADTEYLVRAGAAGFLHMIQDTEDIDPAFIARLRDLRIVFAPTLVRQELDWLYTEHPNLLDDPDVARSVDADVIAAAKQAARDAHAMPAERADFERAMHNTRKLAAGGVLIGVGSDGGSGLDFPGLTTHRELELLVAAGLSPMDVIVAATRNGALALRKSDELGTIEPGRRADLMLVSANPLEDAGNLRKIDRLMLNGDWVDREHLTLK
ncbi:MAG TPA: amidohydrolase family protein [Bryobacteraceae bacterium]|nr:amidohydrolase family protein [Bryobacteraceae bacterium]